MSAENAKILYLTVWILAVPYLTGFPINNKHYFVDPLDARFPGNTTMEALEQPTLAVPLSRELSQCADLLAALL